MQQRQAFGCPRSLVPSSQPHPSHIFWQTMTGAFAATGRVKRTVTGFNPNAKPMTAPHLGRLSEGIDEKDFKIHE